jgi:hypothetical protein
LSVQNPFCDPYIGIREGNSKREIEGLAPAAPLLDNRISARDLLPQYTSERLNKPCSLGQFGGRTLTGVCKHLTAADADDVRVP